MQAMVTAISAFSARGTRGRRGVLLAFAALLALVILGISHEIAVRTAEEALRQAQLESAAGGTSSVLPSATPSTWYIADVIAMILLGGGLFLVAPAMAAAQVGEERRSGTLDLLRTAPLSANQLVAGFLVGAPTSLYLLLSGPLALHVAAGIFGALPLSLVLGSTVLLFSGAAFLMLLSVLAALSIGREAPGGAATLGMAGVMGLFALVTLGFAAEPFSATWAHLHPAGAMSVLYHSFDNDYRESFMSRGYHSAEANAEGSLRRYALTSMEPVFATLVYLLASVLLLFAARRAIAGETPSRLSKLEAVGLFAVATLSIVVPMRAVVSAFDLELGNLLTLALALVVPYLVCVLGATPSATAYGVGRSRGLAAKAAPFWSAVAMLAVGVAMTGLLYGQRIFSVFGNERDALCAIGFLLIALTLPIYSLYASTRISTPGGRLAFWAAVITHVTLQVPAVVIFFEQGTSDSVKHLLANVGLVVGVVVPLVIAWRQHAANRKLAARMV